MLVAVFSFHGAPARCEVMLRSGDPGKPAELVVLTPTRQPGPVSSSELRRRVRDAFLEHTSLEIRELPEERFERCGAVIECLIGRASPESQYVIILKNVTDEESNAISLQLIRLAPGETTARHPQLVATAGERDVRTSSEAAVLLERVVLEDLREYLEREGELAPWGEIRVRVDAADVGVNLDGRAIGATQELGQGVRIVRVTPGERKLRFVREGFEAFETSVEVTRGQVASLEVSLLREAGIAGTVRAITGVTGGAAMAAGIGLVIFALAADRSSMCITARADVSCPAGGGFKAFGNPQPFPATEGPLIGPLGYSLLGAGATWVASSLWLGDTSEVPWLGIAVGVVLGVASYAVSEAATARGAL